jgi:hypothetical protein
MEHLGATPVITITPVPGPSHDAGNLDNKVVDAEYVDGDTFLDIIVSYYDNDNTQPILLYRGNGNGTFQAAETITNNPPGGGGSVALTLGDFDGDFKVDLIVGMDDDGDAGQAWVTKGNGDGTFTLDWPGAFDVNPGVEGGSDHLGTGHCDAFDFNNDGHLDVIALAGQLPGQLFLGQGGFAFSDSITVFPANGIHGRPAAPSRQPAWATPEGQFVVAILENIVTAVFDLVTGAGVTTLQLEDPLSGPSGPGETLAVMDLATTATFDDSVSLTFPYGPHLPDSGYVNETSLTLYHETSPGVWSAVPTLVDLSSRLLHARVPSLSRFAITGFVTPTGLDDKPELPTRHALWQNFPNPFNPTTTIRFDLAESADVVLQIYDVSGRLIRTLVSANKPAGRYAIPWDGRNAGGHTVASGVYFYRLKAGSYTEARKMVLLQ